MRPEMSDWVSKQRQNFADALAMYKDTFTLSGVPGGDANLLEIYSIGADGNVVRDENGLIVTALTADDMAGENAGIDVQEFLETAVAMAGYAAAVPNEVSRKMKKFEARS